MLDSMAGEAPEGGGNMLFCKRRALPEPRNYTPSNALWRRWCWRRIRRNIRKSPAFKLLQRIESASDQVRDKSDGDLGKRTWLLPFRHELRHILAGFDFRFDGVVEVVRYYLLTCPRPMIAICIWLEGEFSDRTRLFDLKTFHKDPSPQIRRHVAKGLRRLEAWPLLRVMAAANPDDARIQWFANAPTAHAPFAERLRKYKQSVDDSHADEVATPSQMPLWMGVSTWERTPPKSVAYIRRMLRRIRFWVRWGVSR
jgi:hypothetical protein